MLIDLQSRIRKVFISISANSEASSRSARVKSRRRRLGLKLITIGMSCRTAKRSGRNGDERRGAGVGVGERGRAGCERALAVGHYSHARVTVPAGQVVAG